MWQHSSRCGVFLEGVSLTLAEKKAKQKQKPMPYMHQDVTFFRKRFAAFDGEKGDTGTPALYGKKRKHTILPSWQTDWLSVLVKRK